MDIQSKTNYERYRILMLVAVSAIFIGLFFLKLPFLESTMLRIDDWKYALPSPHGMAKPYDNAVVVEVDEKSINRLGRWPWDRKVIARLITKMHLAKVIGLDLVLSEPSNPASDRALADAVAQGNVILGYFFRDTASHINTNTENDIMDGCGYNNVVLDSDKVDIKQFAYVEPNIPLISYGMLSCGYFNIQPDLDGLYRRYTLAYLYNGVILAPLAVQMAKFIVNKEPKLRIGKPGIEEFDLGSVHLHNSNTLRVLFDKPVVRVSAYDVLSGKIPPQYFKNKAVVVGITELGIFDMRPTPYEVITPGVYLHYYALRNLMNNNIVDDLGSYNVVFIILFTLAAYLINRVESTRSRMGLYLVLIAMVFVTSATMLFGLKWWLRDSYMLITTLVLILGNEILNVITSRVETSKTKGVLSSYISEELMKEVLADPEKMKLGGEEREITILFADIRNFTSLSEKLSPRDLVDLLNEIFDPLTNHILEQDGMLDKYIGDAIMALYNAPIDQEAHAKNACVSALKMVDEIFFINSKLAHKGHPEIDIGIGVNTGNAVVGNMGSRIRFNYTAIGDSVNLASRVEGLNKYYGTRILVSEFTASKLDDEILIRRLDRIRVKGKEEPIWIYELMKDTPRNRELREQYESALVLYQAQDFTAAQAGFAELFQQYSDKCSKLMAERCRELCEQSPGQGWDGVHIFDTK